METISIRGATRALAFSLLAAAVAAGCATGKCDGGKRRTPNVIFIMADDLGYGDLGSYGQAKIKTPRLDQMAAEGMRFTQFYAGSTVCAPARAVLMTGRHTGHARVRGNAGREIQQLKQEDLTAAEVFKQAGYATALIGKWGLGEDGTDGHPMAKGFDHFYGYLNQVHAHNYYPEFLWRGRRREELGNVVERSPNHYGDFLGGYATKKVDYTHDLFVEETLKWIGDNRNDPFFVYLALTAPHANNEATAMTGAGQEVPDLGQYADTDWEEPAKAQAAMISRIDRDVGRILDTIDQMGLADDTVIMFTSDNGPHAEGGYDTQVFEPSGPLRGMKRDLYEGGIRVPLIVRWTATTPAGSESDHIAYFGDLLATAADLAGIEISDGFDSISIVPTLSANPAGQAEHEYLYWEFYENAGAQAVRFGKWKAVRRGFGNGDMEIYDLTLDLGEAHDLASEKPDLVAQAEEMMADAHTPDEAWQPTGELQDPPPPGRGLP